MPRGTQTDSRKMQRGYTNDNDGREEVIFDMDAEREKRIRREVVRITPIERYMDDDEVERLDYEGDDEAEENTPEMDGGEESEAQVERRSKSLWQHITTGTFFTDGAANYYRYLIAIAAMYFLSIFLSFVQLNADREYRNLQNYATVLNERAVLKEEERYSLSSKSNVEDRLRSYGIELIDLSKHSRLIEK